MKHLRPKKTILLFFIGLASIVSAQQSDSTKEKRNEAGISVFTWYYTDQSQNFFIEPGLLYKHHFNACTVKAFAGGFKTQHYFYDPTDLYTTKHLVLNAGVEKVFFKGWLQFAAGVDLMANFEYTNKEDLPEHVEYYHQYFGSSLTTDIIINFGKYISANLYTDLFFTFAQKDVEDVRFTPIRAFTVNYRF